MVALGNHTDNKPGRDALGAQHGAHQAGIVKADALSAVIRFVGIRNIDGDLAAGNGTGQFGVVCNVAGDPVVDGQYFAVGCRQAGAECIRLADAVGSGGKSDHDRRSGVWLQARCQFDIESMGHGGIVGCA